MLEYFNSTHGARKGLADTALKTANSGYLTRRLVDVAQDCIIIEEDCGTERGLTMRAVVDGGDVIEPLVRAHARPHARSSDVVDPLNGALIVKAGELIDEVEVELIDKAGIEELRIRSVLTCDTKIGVCGKCYGRDLARGTHGQHRRGGRRHRRPVDRRAGHPAHHAHLPHRRRRAARRRAVEHRGEP